MLNLSDKELDRLSRDAAGKYDPGDPTGPGSWEKLSVHLDRELGRVNPNPLRGFRSIRRIPIYYASAILLLTAVSYYFINQGKRHSDKTAPSGTSGSPPLTVVKNGLAGSSASDSSSNTKNFNYNATSTPDKDKITQKISDQPSGNTKDQPAGASAGRSPGSAARPSPESLSPAGSSSARSSSAGSSSAGKTSPSPPASFLNGTTAANKTAETTLSGHTSFGHKSRQRNSRQKASGQGKKTPGQKDLVNAGGQDPARGDQPDNQDLASQTGTNASNVTSTSKAAGPKTVRDPALSSVRAPRSLTTDVIIGDSALRAYTVKNSPAQNSPGKKNSPSLRINRSLHLGLLLAPDFSSVKSLAGDKPGASIGITAGYQFANRWYLGTGILYSRKNYAARSQDYHVPYDYYRMNNMHEVDFVKGSFHMLEISLNLRYDFSVSGNTIFFASGGVSSYLRTHENCAYYYNFFGREMGRGFDYPNKENYLFQAVNLSLGVETGISNSLSLMVAPYVKIPAGQMGFGQVQMSSIGIDFVLKFAPVLSRRRH